MYFEILKDLKQQFIEGSLGSLDASENFHGYLPIYLFSSKAFTHYFKAGEFIRGFPVGSLTERLKELESKFKLVPLIDPSDICRLIGMPISERSDILIELARKYGVPMVPIAATDKVARWFVLPTKGFKLFLAAHNFQFNLHSLWFWVEVSIFRESFRRKLLARCALNRVRWRRFGGHVFVPLDAIFSEETVSGYQWTFEISNGYVLDIDEPIGWDTETILKKGFKAFRQFLVKRRHSIEEVESWTCYKDEDETFAFREYLGELSEYSRLSFHACADLSDRLETDCLEALQMKCEHIAAAVFGSDDGYNKAYARMLANIAHDQTSYAFKPAAKSSDFEDGDPSARFVVLERQRLLAQIFRRQKNHYYRERKFRRKEKPAPLLEKFVEHGKNVLINRFARLWMDESGNKTGVTVDVIGERVRVAILRDSFNELMKRVKNFWVEKFSENISATKTRILAKSLTRWLIETFGIAGFRAVLGNVTDRFRRAFEWVKERERDFVPHFVSFIEQVLLPQTVPR